MQYKLKRLSSIGFQFFPPLFRANFEGGSVSLPKSSEKGQNDQISITEPASFSKTWPKSELEKEGWKILGDSRMPLRARTHWGCTNYGNQISMKMWNDTLWQTSGKGFNSPMVQKSSLSVATYKCMEGRSLSGESPPLLSEHFIFLFAKLEIGIHFEVQLAISKGSWACIFISWRFSWENQLNIGHTLQKGPERAIWVHEDKKTVHFQGRTNVEGDRESFKLLPKCPREREIEKERAGGRKKKLNFIPMPISYCLLISASRYWQKQEDHLSVFSI